MDYMDLAFRLMASEKATDGMLLGALGAVAAVVVYLYKNMEKNHKETKEELDECKTHHREANDQLIDLTRKVGELEGRQQGTVALAQQVLDELSRRGKDGTDN